MHSGVMEAGHAQHRLGQILVFKKIEPELDLACRSVQERKEECFR